MGVSYPLSCSVRKEPVGKNCVCIQNESNLFVNRVIGRDLSTRNANNCFKRSYRLQLDNSEVCSSCKTLRDMRANLRSAVGGVGGMNQLPSLSDFVIGAFLQMRMLSIMIPLMVPGSH